MKSAKGLIQMVVPLTAIWLIACVTINIYFPAEKVETVAEGIVEDIRGKVPKEKNDTEPLEDSEKPLSFINQIFNLLEPESAYAQEVTEVSNATIRTLKENMRQRYPQLKPFLSKNVIKEGADGYVAEGDMKEVDLKTRRLVKSLVGAENADRKRLYEEVATALKIDPGQVNQVAEIFAKQWQKSVP